VKKFLAFLVPLMSFSLTALPTIGGGRQVGDGNLAEVGLGVMPAPPAKAAAATLTMAELTSGIIACTSSGSYSLTTMTGTEIDAALVSAKVGSCFDLAINHASSTNVVTLAGGTGVTVVGLATVTGITSGSFRFRKTGTATWSVYRI